ncbi:MAG: hypothetical protein IKT17_10210, partial [Lachnospiraceae bacterium]|nr:hypothetical protein [Lachnospiraceae bacterium]
MVGCVYKLRQTRPGKQRLENKGLKTKPGKQSPENTKSEYEAFEPGAVDGTDDTYELVKRLNSDKKII